MKKGEDELSSSPMGWRGMPESNRRRRGWNPTYRVLKTPMLSIYNNPPHYIFCHRYPPALFLYPLIAFVICVLLLLPKIASDASATEFQYLINSPDKVY